MTAIRSFIQRHAVLTYYALVFAISWGGILVVVGPGGFPATKEESETLFPIVLLVLFAGPSVAGLMLTVLVYGRSGFRDLLARMTGWQVGARAAHATGEPSTSESALWQAYGKGG